MKKLLLVFALVLLSAATAFAWSMKISVNGISYEGRSTSNGMEFLLKGNVVALARSDTPGEIIYSDVKNRILGYAVHRAVNEKDIFDYWEFQNARRIVLGTARKTQPGASELIYHDARGRDIGLMGLSGPWTQYLDGRRQLIGKADTASLPLRPIPLEPWFVDLLTPSVCLAVITDVNLDKPAAAAGLRAGDVLIGWEGQNWTTFDFLDADRSTMGQKVFDHVMKTLDLKDPVMIVYRPDPEEFKTASGMAKGKILRLRPMGPGSKGFFFNTYVNGPTFRRNNSINYCEQIKKLYISGDFHDAPAAFMPDPASLKKDGREVPGGHLELRESVLTGTPVFGWLWVRDKDGVTMRAKEIDAALYKAAMDKQPRIVITSYPLAQIYISDQTDRGSGDPALSNKFKLIGMADEQGSFPQGGKDTYVLPLGAKAIAFRAEPSQVSMDEINAHPMITSLPANTLPAVRNAMISQVRTMLTMASGRKPELKFGYVPVDPGKTRYELK